ncbi:MAG TPA: VWA domain-containing protein [Pseudonocardiaceae bacterium]|nr:VWA domain-containing protein [Pseudonocardiaceae bacterium]
MSYTFDVEVSQNEYLPDAGTMMDAVISVECKLDGGAPAGPPGSVAQVIMIDCSMSMTGAKLEEAKQATQVAIDTLRDGVEFAIVAGNHWARLVYPENGGLAVVSNSTRAKARHALRRVVADGGTAIGAWLDLTRELLAGHPAQIKHAILLTDGKNESQAAARFREALDRCRGVFVCDSRGVGSQWNAEPLLAIAECLLGSAEGLPDAGGLSADFQAIVEGVMGKMAADVLLRVWTATDTTITLLAQNYPWIADQLGQPSPAGARFTDYPLGPWGDEHRDYHLRLQVPPGQPGDERAGARVSVVVGDVEFAEKTVWIQWTDDPVLSTKMNAKVAGATKQTELADAIAAGLNALGAGRRELATLKLAQAVDLARQHGREDTLKVLRTIVDVPDSPGGTVRIRRSMADVDAEMARLESRKTMRTHES